MAAGFAPNLDDGELWLPSAIIPELESPRRISSGPDVKSLAKQLSALGLLDPYLYPNGPEPSFERTPDLAKGFRPATGFGFGCDGYRVSAGPGAYTRGSAAVPRFNAPRIVHVQAQGVDGFGQGRARAATRVFPSRFNGSGRACAGTGVFLPRVYNSRETMVVKRKPDSVKNGENLKQPVRKTKAAAAAAAAAKKMVPLIQAPAELTLPQEWTY